MANGYKLATSSGSPAYTPPNQFSDKRARLTSGMRALSFGGGPTKASNSRRGGKKIKARKRVSR